MRTDQTLSLYATLIDDSDSGVKDLAALALMQLGPERLAADRLAGLMSWSNQPYTEGLRRR